MCEEGRRQGLVGGQERAADRHTSQDAAASSGAGARQWRRATGRDGAAAAAAAVAGRAAEQGKPGQSSQKKRVRSQHAGRADLEPDRLVAHGLAGARDALRLGGDLGSDAVKVGEDLARRVQELPPLARRCWRACAWAAACCRCCRCAGAGAGAGAGRLLLRGAGRRRGRAVLRRRQRRGRRGGGAGGRGRRGRAQRRAHELQHKGAASADVGAARQEVAADLCLCLFLCMCVCGVEAGVAAKGLLTNVLPTQLLARTLPMLNPAQSAPPAPATKTCSCLSQRSARSKQKRTHQRLEHARLAAALRADDGDLRQRELEVERDLVRVDGNRVLNI